MDQAPGAERATPNPSLPKTIGTLNIVFGVMLLLCGGGCLRVAGGVMSGNPYLRLDPELTKEAAAEMRRNFLEELRRREAATTDKAEKARLREERERIEARPESLDTQVDFAKVNRGTRLFATYLWSDVVTGPVLNLLMLIAGVGLVRLKGWGRALGVWVATLKIVRLVGLGVFLLAFVLPALNRGFDEFTDTDYVEVPSAKMREDQRQKQGGGVPGAQPVALSPAETVKALKTMGYIWALLYTSFGVIYPLIALIVLTRPAVKAAVAPADELEQGESA